MLKSIRTGIEKPDYTNITSVFKFKSAFELSKTTDDNLEQIDRLQLVKDPELQDVTEYYSNQKATERFSSVNELITDLDSE